MLRLEETSRTPPPPASHGRDCPPTQGEVAPLPEYITLAEVTRIVPGRAGKRVALVTVHRWCGRGLRNGLRLRAVKIGGRRYTTLGWVQEFIEASSRDSCPAVEPPPSRPPGRRRSASERAAAELEAAWGRKRE